MSDTQMNVSDVIEAAHAQIVSLTAEDVLSRPRPEAVHHNLRLDHDGTCAVFRVDGDLRTWKERPGHFWLPLRRGHKEHSALSHENVDLFHAVEHCPVDRAIAGLPRDSSMRVELTSGNYWIVNLDTQGRGALCIIEDADAGWRHMDRLIDLAAFHGMQLTAREALVVELYRYGRPGGRVLKIASRAEQHINDHITTPEWQVGWMGNALYLANRAWWNMNPHSAQLNP